MAGIGRETKLDDLVTQRVVNAVKKGATRARAAEVARVTDTTLQNWLAWGKEGREPYATFFEKVRVAEAELEGELAFALKKMALAGDRQACIFLLERRIRGEWSPPKEAASTPAASRATAEEEIEIARALIRATERSERERSGT